MIPRQLTDVAAKALCDWTHPAPLPAPCEACEADATLVLATAFAALPECQEVRQAVDEATRERSRTREYRIDRITDAYLAVFVEMAKP